MLNQTRALCALVLLAFAVGPVSVAPASAQSPAGPQAGAEQGTLSGTVTDARGTPLAGAQVVVQGNGQSASVTTRGDGKFSVTLPPGLYNVTVAHGGYQSAQNDIAVAGGTTQTVNVSLQEATLQSLRTIGRTGTTATGNRAPFNVSESTVNTLPPQLIQLRQAPNLTDVVADMPGVSATRTFSSTPNTNFAVRGLSVQTRTTIDGHPVSSGIAGTWNTNYANSFMFQNVEVVKGTGLNGAIAGESAVGTVNLRTRDFTSRNSGELVLGIDNYGAKFMNAVADVNFARGRGSLILQKAYQGFNGPWNNYFGDRVGAISTAPVATLGPPSIVGLDQWRGDFSNRYFTAGELVKGRWRFSDATSLTLEYLGLQGGYAPQGGSYGTWNGFMTMQACRNGPVFSATLAGCTASSTYTAPYTFGMIGQSVPAYTWFPDSFIQNNEPQFAAELRTQWKNDTLFLRPYTHLINRFISGAYENTYPGNAGGWNAVTNVGNCQVQYLAPGAAPGTGAAGPCFTTNAGPAGVPYVGASPALTTVFPTTTNAPACSAVAPFTCWTTPTGIQNNGAYGYGTPFSQPEIDRLNGYTFTWLHPVGDNTYSFSVDYRKDYTQSASSDTTLPAPGCQYVVGSVNGKNVYGSGGVPFQPGCSIAQYPTTSAYVGYNLLPRSPIGTPPTVANYTDLSLNALWQITPQLRIALGNYFEIYSRDAQIENPAVLATYAALGNSAAAPVALVTQRATYNHYDPHIGIEWRILPQLSLRVNGGSSITQPYASLVSGFGSITLPNAANGQNYTNTIPNYQLQPETSVAYDVGADYRARDGTVLSLDGYDVTVHNVWLAQQTTIAPIAGITANNFFQTNQINGPLERSYGIEAQVLKNPVLGWGWYVTASVNRTYYDQLPMSIYAGNTSQTNVNYNINKVQIFGFPFFKSYGQAFYNGRNGTQYEFGVDWEGQNNSTFGPPYFVGDAAVRVPVRDPRVHLQLAVNNLFAYQPAGLARAIGSQGYTEPGVYLSNGQLVYAGPYNTVTGAPNTAVATPFQSLPPRTFRLSLQLGF